MAANWDKEAKTFVVAEGETGNKHDRFVGLFGRRRIVDKTAGTAIDRRSAVFGLWSKNDTYSLVETSREQGSLYRRTHGTSFNGFRTKDTEYYPSRGKKSEERRYLGGLLTSGVGYDTDGEIIRRSKGDFMGKVTWAKSTDSRTQASEHEELFGWYHKKQQSLALPGDKAVKWRTMERRIGSYEMTIKATKDGAVETRTHGFGRTFGKNWLFSRTSVYNFETGQKTTTYKGLFGLLTREGERNGRPINAKEKQKYQERVAQKDRASDAWEKHTLSLSNTAGVATPVSDHGSIFEGKLRELGSGREANSKQSLDAWLDREVEGNKAALGREERPARDRKRVSFDKELAPIAFGESARETDFRPAAVPTGKPRLRPLNYNGVTLPPDTPPHLLTNRPGRSAKPQATSSKAGATFLTDSEDSGSDMPDRRTSLKKPVLTGSPSDRNLAGIVAETTSLPLRKATRLKNTTWNSGTAVASDSDDSASETPPRQTRRNSPPPTRAGHPSDKNLAGIVDEPAEQRRAPAAPLKNSSWRTTTVNLPDSDDERAHVREPYKKEQRAPVDRSFDKERSSERDRGSSSSLDLS